MFVGAILILCGLLSLAFLLAQVYVNSSTSELGQGSAFNPQEPSSQELSSSLLHLPPTGMWTWLWELELPSWTRKLQLQDRDKRLRNEMTKDCHTHVSVYSSVQQRIKPFH